jgi:hypothetical protein
VKPDGYVIGDAVPRYVAAPHFAGRTGNVNGGTQKHLQMDSGFTRASGQLRCSLAALAVAGMTKCGLRLSLLRLASAGRTAALCSPSGSLSAAARARRKKPAGAHARCARVLFGYFLLHKQEKVTPSQGCEGSSQGCESVLTGTPHGENKQNHTRVRANQNHPHPTLSLKERAKEKAKDRHGSATTNTCIGTNKGRKDEARRETGRKFSPCAGQPQGE